MAQPQQHPDRDFLALIGKINRVFRPSAPIDDRGLFAGRIKQLEQLVDIAMSPGQHAVMYGERGVGKTSLASVCRNILSGSTGFIAVKINCDVTDNFASIWGKVVDGLGRMHEAGELPTADPGSAQAIERAAEVLGAMEVGPREAVDGLSVLAKKHKVVVFIDEFDTVLDFTSRTLFANTIKTLSDYNVDATLVFVGVADTVDELIAEHESIGRNLFQILMPRMTVEELTDIITTGLDAAGMTADQDAVSYIVKLSQGLPHYTHLLAQKAARNAASHGRRNIESEDVWQAVVAAVSNAQHSIKTLYHAATTSPQREHLYGKVLTACALARCDDLGFFAPADVREPLQAVTGKNYQIPAFVRHLTDFCEVARGPVLQRRGTSHKYRYRFLNPLLQPYVIMKGLSSDLITQDMALGTDVRISG
ncbi:ATP-binding protein [Micromonospora sp. WMMD998]|uniref:AAA family ATPase n=1 Tax=Micromonospora sp. WMMD998 TaxID=3016092 RepID=UPI00249CD1AB|nr:ATP-binding protein [Micromonospora sp. WMMD998]WFE37992.1 ATP-binding protein [Micromonospora sp. WMMD998]